MRGSYLELLRTPGALAFSSTGLIARMPISQLGIATVLLVSASTGTYALAGAVAGAATLAGAVMMPQVARFVDRHGQARVARPVIVLGAFGWILLSLAVTLAWPVWSWFVFAVIGGGSAASIGPMVRKRWVHVLPDKPLQRRAFAWEAALDEVVFVTGPPLATFLATAITPYAGIVGATVLLLGGGLLFLAQRSSEPPPTPPEEKPSPFAIVSGAMLAVLLVQACAGIMFGSVDVVVIAFAEAEGQKGAAGWLLAAYAFGSLLSGLGFGLLHVRRSIGAQFVAASLLAGVLQPLLLLPHSLPTLALAMFACGFAVAPMLISAALLIEHLVPPAALTEGLTWTSTAVVLGVTVGAAAGGSLVDLIGARAALIMPVGSAALAAVVALAVSPLLRGPRLPHRG